MTFRINDNNEKKLDHKENDESFKKFCEENKNNDKIEYVDKKRNRKGVLQLWEIHYKDLEE